MSKLGDKSGSNDLIILVDNLAINYSFVTTLVMLRLSFQFLSFISIFRRASFIHNFAFGFCPLIIVLTLTFPLLISSIYQVEHCSMYFAFLFLVLINVLEKKSLIILKVTINLKVLVQVKIDSFERKTTAFFG